MATVAAVVEALSAEDVDDGGGVELRCGASRPSSTA